MTVLTAYQSLVDSRDALARGASTAYLPLDLNTMDDVLLLIKHAQRAATLCACPVPRQGDCSACMLAEDLRHLGVPKQL